MAVFRENKYPSLCCWTGLRLSEIDCAGIVTAIDRNRRRQALQVIDFKCQLTAQIRLSRLVRGFESRWERH
jgi:hypothetical protein